MGVGLLEPKQQTSKHGKVLKVVMLFICCVNEKWHRLIIVVLRINVGTTVYLLDITEVYIVTFCHLFLLVFYEQDNFVYISKTFFKGKKTKKSICCYLISCTGLCT